MSRNQAGNYTLPLPPVVPGDVIESQWANTTTSDLAEGLTQSLDRSGRGAMLAPLILSSDPITQPFQATSKAYVDKFLSYATGMPIAAITAYSANGAIPPGWLLCDGQAVSRTTYPDLFAAIGTIYGAGDGSTTFNVPNLTNEFIRGFGAGRTLGVAQNGAILAHAHGIADQSHSHSVSFDSGLESQNHTHSGHTLTAVAAGDHAHNMGRVAGGAGSLQFTPGGGMADITPNTTTNGAHTHGITGNTDAQSLGHRHNVSGPTNAAQTGINITQSTGGGENIPRNMPMFYIIKAIKDGTSTITPVLAITTNDTQMISVIDTDPTVPVLNIHSNVPFGIPKLDANAKVPLAQIPNMTSNNLGFFDASSGNLPSGTFASGDTYTISVAGTLTVYDPVTLVAAPTVVPQGTNIIYITGSPTNPTGWYAEPLQTNVVASSVSFTPGGTISAGNVQAAIAELDSETQAALGGKAPSSAATAAGTSFSPAGTIAATNVQAAIQELDTEKAPSSASTAAGTSFAPAGTIVATNVQAAIAELDTETQAAFAKLRPVLILNGLPSTTPAGGYVPSTLLWGGGPLNPLGMYNLATGVITIVEAGLYRFAGQFRCNNPGVAEAEFSVGLATIAGTPTGAQEFSPLITSWPASAEVRWLPYATTVRCAAGDQFRFEVSAASGTGCSVGGGNIDNSRAQVTRIG